VGSLFEEFKNDRGWKSSSFYVVFLIRRLLYVTLLFALIDFPLVQVILSAGLSALVALYLVTYRPCRERVLNYCSLYSEFASLLIYVCISSFLLQLDNKRLLKWVALCQGYSITLVYSGASLYLTIMKLKAKYKSLRTSVDL
jgi:hypothetical protein